MYRFKVWFVLLGLCGFILSTVGCGGKESPEEKSQTENVLEPGPKESVREADGGQNERVPDGGQVERTPDASVGKEEKPELSCSDTFVWPVPKQEISVPASKAWKGELNLSNDSFFPAVYDRESRWVKFTILLRDPTKVYFQDGKTFSYHYDFASKHLPPFQGQSRAEFSQKTLYKKGQEAVLGAVLLAPQWLRSNEYSITLERQDAYHPEMVRILYELVKSKLVQTKSGNDFYFPSFHQQESAQALRDCYEKKNLSISSSERWARGDQCYSMGWALGRLQKIAGSDIAKAYREGRLKPTDILLTDAVPSEIPHVAGILSLTPTTPNSHVVILAQTFQIPFGYLRAQKNVVDSLVGKEIMLRVRTVGSCDIQTVAMGSNLDTSTRNAIAARKKTKKVSIPEKQTYGKLHTSTEGLTSSNIKHVGGKAANFALLRKAIPQNSPVSIAISFDLWDQFMQQKVMSGKSLREEINVLLKDFKYPPTMSLLQTALKKVRDLIEDKTTFTQEQQQAIMGALKIFDPKMKIRFRSSTNVEDSELFTGAGLYESHSGCVLEDQDTDTKGPSLCDSSKEKERGVFRAIRKTYASFYNDNAFLERLRFGLDESKVAMGLLVHPSFPDQNELANGVATIRKQNNSYSIKLVTQNGAASVANPDGNAQPEVLIGTKYSTTPINFSVEQRSSLVPVGTYVMKPDDYKELGQLLIKVAQLFEQKNPTNKIFMLDLEYKKIQPGKLIIKQVRQIPLPDSNKTEIPFFMGKPSKQCVFQGEYSDVFAIHRLKSTWDFQPKVVELTPENRKKSLFSAITLNYLKNDVVAQLTGSPETWPNAKHTVDKRILNGQFSDGSGDNQRTIALSVDIPEEVPVLRTPIVLLEDLNLYVKVTYRSPVAYIDYNQKINTRKEETVRLTNMCQSTVVTKDFLLQKRTMKGPNQLQVETSYYWPPGPQGVSAGYTAPLIKWVKTEITGLTSTTIVLTDIYSQSYRPEHHNFGEKFIFEPGYSSNLTQTQRNELKAKNIKAIFLSWDRDSNPPTIVKYIGLDGKLREP